jgi:hypothetical protein
VPHQTRIRWGFCVTGLTGPMEAHWRSALPLYRDLAAPVPSVSCGALLGPTPAAVGEEGESHRETRGVKAPRASCCAGTMDWRTAKRWNLRPSKPVGGTNSSCGTHYKALQAHEPAQQSHD